MRYWLIMPAAGSGRRFGAAALKQYTALEGATVIEWALSPFVRDSRCAGIVVAVPPGDREWTRIAARVQTAQRAAGAPPPALVAVAGGGQRSQSVRLALEALAGRAAAADWVLVHDAARPCLGQEDLDRLLERAGAHPVGGVLAVRAADTLKRSSAAASSRPDAEVAIAETVDRGALWRALTPQMFRYGRLCAALDAAHAAQRFPTDEGQALEWQGEAPALIAGAASNLKITTAEDLVLAAAILRSRQLSQAREATHMRTGTGFDIHAFGTGDFVMLGGVRIAHSRGIIAHSDGDVLLHALCDALLGAAGLGDIGQHFSDSDPRWRGADSRGFVAEVLRMLGEHGLEVVNADLTVLAESPKVAPHRDAIREAIAQLLGVARDRVNIKATTTEGLGFLGRAEGIAAQASVLLAESAAWRPRS